MGWETGIISAVSAFNSFNQTNQAQASASAIIKQGEYEAQNIADNTLRKAGTLQTSFLQSGLALDDGTKAVMNMAFAQGQTDISRTLSNANAQAKNTVSAARIKSLESLSSTLKSSASDLSKAWDGSVAQDMWNGLGQDLGSALDPSPTGPYMSPLSMSYYKN